MASDLTEQDGYLWYDFASGKRREAVGKWCYKTGLSWAQWRKDRPTLRVVKVILVPVEARNGQ